MAVIGGIVAPTSGAATGRRTFGDLKSELARPVDPDDSTTLSLAGEAIRSAIRKYNAFGNWPWEIETEEIAITSGTDTYSVSNTIKKPLALQYISASGEARGDERFTYVPYEVYIEGWDLNNTGKTYGYTYRNLFESAALILLDKPGADDTALLTYYRRTPTPTNDSTPMEGPEEALEAYMQEGWYEFMKRLPEGRRVMDVGTAFLDAQRMRRRMVVHVTRDADSVRSGR